MRRIVILTMFGTAYVVGRAANVWRSANPAWKWYMAFLVWLVALNAFNVVIAFTR